METILKYNEQLYGAPIGVLIGIFAIALGYLLKTIPQFNNRWIPTFVVAACTVGFVVAAPEKAADTAWRIYIVRNLVIGFIIGFSAWTFHAQILRRWVDPKFFPEDVQPAPEQPPTPPPQQ